ncbi:MAG TPA: UDP-N-acetylmuramoyl-L-alanine--D-glutamate ligase, partial [Rhodospirillales bacterium]|nr:UDP-N-acetylmuramoyl-L-alanine--D-glutamate ligase [Rhodospirillales bacterium]
MIDVRSLTGQTVAVFGLGRSGLASALALVESGAHVAAWDDNPSSRDDAADQGVPLVDPYVSDWSQPVALVFSPGIPQRYPQPHAIAAMARQARVEIICDIELLARSQPQATLLGVTGTNGKSTTTALIGDILEMAGSPVQVGGNLGTPALELNPLGEDGTYVMEVSSYQLDLLSSA